MLLFKLFNCYLNYSNIRQEKHKFINHESCGILRIFSNSDIFLIGILYLIKINYDASE